MIRNSQLLEVTKNMKFPLHTQNPLHRNPSQTEVSPNTILKFPFCEQFCHLQYLVLHTHNFHLVYTWKIPVASASRTQHLLWAGLK